MMKKYAAIMLLLLSLNGQSQEVSYSILFNNDTQITTGCDVSASGQSDFSGIDNTLEAQVNLNTLQVTAINLYRCQNGSLVFDQNIGTPYPVGLDNGAGGTDAIELSVPLDQLINNHGSTIQLMAVADDGTGSDILQATGGNVILFGLPILIPTLGFVATLMLILLMMLLSRKMLSKPKAAIAAIIVTSAAWASMIMVDGDTSDWQGRTAVASDPLNDSTNGLPSIDITQLYAALQDEQLFFRIDIKELQNNAPIALDDTYTLSEKATLTINAPGILANDTDAQNDTLEARLIDGPMHAQSFVLNADGGFTYEPNADFVGSDQFTYRASDGSTESAIAVVNLVIDSVNDAPSFNISTDAIIDEDAGPQSLINFATNISAGPDDESSQLLTFSITDNDNTQLFIQPPQLSADGTLSFEAVANGNGQATLTVELMDDGGTANGGTDTSAPQIFTITVNGINDAPSFDLLDALAIAEDAAAQTIADAASNISAGPSDEVTQALNFNVNNDNNALFTVQPQLANDGTLIFTPADQAVGSANVTVTLMDDGGTANGGIDTSAAQILTITIDAVNDAPSFTAGPDQTINEDAGSQTVLNWATAISDGDDDSQTLTFDVINDNNALFSTQPAISADGTLTYTPADDAFGATMVTVILMDNGGTANGGVDTSAAQSFTITIDAINDAPSFTAGADQNINEDAGPQTVLNWASAISDGDDGSQTLTFDVSNDNNALFSSQPAISADGSLTYTPADDAFGATMVTVILMDNGGTANGGVDTSAAQSFNILVNAVNDAPSFTAGPDQIVNEDAGSQTVINWASAISDGDDGSQTLTFNVTNNNNALFSTQPVISTDGTLIYTPANDAVGIALVSVTLIDDAGTINGGIDTSTPQTFSIVINAINDVPSFTAGPDQNVNEDAGLQTVFNWASAISDGDNGSQTLTFNVTNDNNALFSTQPSISADGTLSFTAAADAFGVANVDVVLMDNGGTANGGVDMSSSQSFSIMINSINDVPSFNLISDININEDSDAQVLMNVASAIVAGPLNESGQALTFNTSNDNNMMFTVQPQLSTDGILTFTLAPEINGTAQISVVLSDDGGVANGGVDTSASQSLTLTVAAINDQPSFVVGPDQTVNEDAGIQSIANWASAISDGDNGSQTLTFVVNNDNPALFSAQPSVSADGTLIYTPTADAFGSAMVTLSLIDDCGTTNGGIDTSANQMFAITVNPVNDAPSFSPPVPFVSVNEDSGPISIDLFGGSFDAGASNETAQNLSFVITNNSDASFFAVQPQISDTGLLTFTTNDNFNSNSSGSPSIRFVLVDDGGTLYGGQDTSTIGSLLFVVDPINDEPSFDIAGNVMAAEDAGLQTINAYATNIQAGPLDESLQSFTFNVSNDNNALFSQQPAIAANGQLTYQSAANANGVANVTVSLMDDGGTANSGIDTSAAQNFNITITPQDDVPTAINDTATVAESSGANTIDVLNNDLDIDGGPISIASVTQPTRATVVITNGGTDLTFQPDPEICNDGSPTTDFTYTLSPGGNTATVAVTITCRNDPPQAVNDSFETVANTILEVDSTPSASPAVFVMGSLLSNDTDIDSPSSSLTASLNTATSGAIVNVNADGSFTYIPPAGQTSNDSFTYDVSDGMLSSTGTVTISFINRVWYVDNNSTAGGLGRSSDPFDTLAEAQTASAAGDTVYVFEGDGTFTGQNVGFDMKPAQRLLGEGVDLTLSDTINGMAGITLFDSTSNNRPVITGADGTSVIRLDAAASDFFDVEIRGLEVNGSVSPTDSRVFTVINGIDINASSTFEVEAVISDNLIDRANMNGINVVIADDAIGNVLVDNNIVNRFNLFGILGQAHTQGVLDITIQNNTVDRPGAFAADGIRVTSGNNNTGQSSRVCLDIEDRVAPIGDNNASNTLAFDEGYELQQYTGATFEIEGLSTSDCSGNPCSGTSNTQMEEFLIDNNDRAGGGTTTANVRTASRIVQYTDGTCTAPSL